MSDQVMITLIICFTVIFVFLILAIIARWICLIALNSQQNKSDDDYLTIDEFEEFEHIVAKAIYELENKIGGDKGGKE